MNDIQPEGLPGNESAQAMHGAEQMYAEASKHLDAIIAYGTEQLPTIHARAGGNSDISVTYDWWKAYIQLAEEQGQLVANLLGRNNNGAHDMTIMMCAAAITRLMHSTDEGMRANTLLAQLDKEMDE